MRDDLEQQFWDDVAGLLIREYGYSEAIANAGISHYRQLLFSNRIGDTVYNRGEGCAADAIAASLERP
jgi:hypothetical protein